ncbi:hypothetical protein [Roseateles sp. MS654]|uniref:hypothetical protein n=1 Tax=Roseateles sp. MS654 TaxID=3412685 RepID=UPI003C2C4B52
MTKLKSVKLPFLFGMVRAVVLATSVILVAACAGKPAKREIPTVVQERRDHGMAMWKSRCERSGVFVHKTISDVEGIYLMNIRLRSNFGESVEDQYALDDPYGHDSTGDLYIHNFLRGFHHHPKGKPSPYKDAPRIGYDFVEAVDPTDGKLYRFTSRIEEPWLTDKRYLKGVTQLVLERTPIEKRSARYGVKFEDISTRQDRDYWIAGSSLKIIDLETGEVLGERIGYMIDWAQGSRAGNRSPWLFAADNACPSFFHGLPRRSPGFVSQAGQTLDFTELVLKTRPKED